MRIKLCTAIFLFFFSCGISSGQDYIHYFKKVAKAELLVLEGNHKEAIIKYENAFLNLKPFSNDLYNAAKCYHKEKRDDIVFQFLDKALQSGVIWNYLENDSDFISLHPDARWKKLETNFPAYRALYLRKLNTRVKHEIDSLVKIDQQYRRMISYGTMDKHLIDSISLLDSFEEFQYKQSNANQLPKNIEDSLTALQDILDSRNMDYLKKIINTAGYPGFNLIGDGSATIILMHSPFNFRLEIFPDLVKEIKKGNIKPYDVAAMIDQMLLYTGKKQKYGTFTQYDDSGNIILCPIEDIVEADKYRDEIGLEPLSDYLKKRNLNK